MDNDSYGHVNNVTYYSYFDTAVNEHLVRDGGLDIATVRRSASSSRPAAASMRRSRFPRRSTPASSSRGSARRASRYEIGLFRQGEDAPAATGRFVHVWVDRATQRPVPVPPRIRAALEPLVADDAPMTRRRRRRRRSTARR